MAKKTKEEANETREALLDAAERVFCEHGVGGSTLNDIAIAANLTRGALYHHFKNKKDLIEGIMERALFPQTLPEIDDISDYESVLDYAKNRSLSFIRELSSDHRLKTVNKIIHIKCEMSIKNSEIFDYYQEFLSNIFLEMESMLELAKSKGELSDQFSTRTAGLMLFSQIHGLIDLWLHDIADIDLIKEGETLISEVFSSLQKK